MAPPTGFEPATQGLGISSGALLVVVRPRAMSRSCLVSGSLESGRFVSGCFCPARILKVVRPTCGLRRHRWWCPYADPPRDSSGTASGRSTGTHAVAERQPSPRAGIARLEPCHRRSWLRERCEVVPTTPLARTVEGTTPVGNPGDAGRRGTHGHLALHGLRIAAELPGPSTEPMTRCKRTPSVGRLATGAPQAER